MKGSYMWSFHKTMHERILPRVWYLFTKDHVWKDHTYHPFIRPMCPRILPRAWNPVIQDPTCRWPITMPEYYISFLSTLSCTSLYEPFLSLAHRNMFITEYVQTRMCFTHRHCKLVFTIRDRCTRIYHCITVEDAFTIHDRCKKKGACASTALQMRKSCKCDRRNCADLISELQSSMRCANHYARCKQEVWSL